jgi:hypothetical protein
MRSCLVHLKNQKVFKILKLKNFQNFSSHRILRHMHEALNIDKNKKKLITQFVYKSRDESFDPS